MPRVAAEQLHRIGLALLVAAGAPRDEAEIVMRHSIEANLAGHDSHGIIQIPTYVDRMTVGHLVPGAPWTGRCSWTWLRRQSPPARSSSRSHVESRCRWGG